VNVGGEMVRARIWRVDVGRTPLYLLDSNIKGNSERSRRSPRPSTEGTGTCGSGRRSCSASGECAR